jgi:hypothetical protein
LENSEEQQKLYLRSLHNNPRSKEELTEQIGQLFHFWKLQDSLTSRQRKSPPERPAGADIDGALHTPRSSTGGIPFRRYIYFWIGSSLFLLSKAATVGSPWSIAALCVLFLLIIISVAPCVSRKNPHLKNPHLMDHDWTSLLSTNNLVDAFNQAEECLSILRSNRRSKKKVPSAVRPQSTIIDPIYTLIEELINDGEVEKANELSKHYLDLIDLGQPLSKS